MLYHLSAAILSGAIRKIQFSWTQEVATADPVLAPIHSVIAAPTTTSVQNVETEIRSKPASRNFSVTFPKIGITPPDSMNSIEQIPLVEALNRRQRPGRLLVAPQSRAQTGRLGILCVTGLNI